MDEIEIKNFKIFVKNHDDINLMLNSSSHDLADIVVDSNYYVSEQNSVNSMLDSLKKVHVSPRLSEGGSLREKLNVMVDDFDKSSIALIYALEYAEKVIDSYSKGESVSQEASSIFDKVMQGATDVGVFWLISEYLKDKPGLSSLGFLLSYGTDVNYSDGDFLVGETVEKIAGELWDTPLMDVEGVPYKHIAAGGVAVMVFTGFKDTLLDEGEFTSEDAIRTGADVLLSGANFAGWEMIAAGVGGIPGVFLASAVTFAAAPVVEGIKDVAAGDNIVHTFTKDGVKYPVPRNGNGKEGTSDIIFKNYSEASNNSRLINDQTYTDYKYKSYLYKDWENVYPTSRVVYGDEATDQFNTYLKEIKEAKSPAVVKQIEDKLSRANPESFANEAASVYEMLQNEDFDLQEYYDYYHGGLDK